MPKKYGYDGDKQVTRIKLPWGTYRITTRKHRRIALHVYGARFYAHGNLLIMGSFQLSFGSLCYSWEWFKDYKSQEYIANKLSEYSQYITHRRDIWE